MKFDGAAFKNLEGLNVGILKFFPYDNEEERVPIQLLYNLIDDIEDESIGIVICFGAFTDKV